MRKWAPPRVKKRTYFAFSLSKAYRHACDAAELRFLKYQRQIPKRINSDFMESMLIPNIWFQYRS